MADKPILFSGPMIRALLEGRKTMTRRVLGTRGHCNIFEPGAWSDDYVMDPGNAEWRARDTPYAVGDRLWVREAFVFESFNSDIDYDPPHNDGRPTWWTYNSEWGHYWTQPHYRASDKPPELTCDQHEGPCCHWKPSIHMPRWASRLTLLVTVVKVERLQEISEEDARAEGILWVPGHGEITPADLHEGYSNYLCCRQGFEVLWDSLHGPGAWEANPWVAAVSFTVHRANIDHLAKEAA